MHSHYKSPITIHTHLKHDINLISQWVCVNQCNLQRYSVGIEEGAGLDSRGGNKSSTMLQKHNISLRVLVRFTAPTWQQRGSLKWEQL